jgi:acyl-CoA reductase-like NAD-dependent aldehyde dehydrogenase
MATIELNLDNSRRAELDQALAVLRQNQVRWARLPAIERASLLDQLLGTVRAAAAEWVRSSQEAKGLDPNTPRAGEEWLNGPYLVARNIRLLKRSLVDVSQRGVPRLPGRPFLRNGKVVAPVFPTDFYDRIMFGGYRAEIVMQPHVTLEQLNETMAVAYRETEPAGAVCLVLGAGNVSSIGPMDVLYKLFVENQVVALKIHPLLSYLRSAWTDALRPLIDWGALRIVEGGRDEGTYLAHHDCVDEIHLTGSVATHDAIVFGTGADAAWRKEQGQPILNKRVTSELGNVSAMIVVPGQWRQSDILFQAENVASSLVNNAGFNCNATRVIVTHRQWPQRAEFLAALRNVLANVPPREAYYPGARERYELFLQKHPDAEQLGSNTNGSCLPWTLIAGLDADQSQDICYHYEAFCSVTSEAALEAEDSRSFVRRAVDFVNGTVTGSLNASLIVPPAALRSPARPAIQEAIDTLQVGTVAVNHWAALGYALCSTTWGAFPGHTIGDVQSGRGVVHNTYMFSAPEKSIIYGPFRPWPKPVWLLSHRRAHQLGPKLLEFECSPSPLRLPSIFRYACEL